MRIGYGRPNSGLRLGVSNGAAIFLVDDAARFERPSQASRFGCFSEPLLARVFLAVLLLTFDRSGS
jgi:hypothetical protein